MTTQQTGTITTWKNDKGFGFITPDHGDQQVFFHISDLVKNQARPGAQMKVSFTLGFDQQQRPRATNIRLTQAKMALPALPLLTAGAFFLILTLWTLITRLPPWVPVIYILVSLITFFVYGSDKQVRSKEHSACQNQRSICSNSLVVGRAQWVPSPTTATKP